MATVVATTRLDHPNAISSSGRTEFTVAFRWFLTDAVPGRPTVTVIEAAAVATQLG